MGAHMKIGKFCTGNAAIATASTSVLNAAKVMRDCGAQAVVVVADDNRTSPVGVVSLETLVWEVMAGEENPAKIRLSDVMTNRFLSVKESDSLFDTIRQMFDGGVARVVIVDDLGHLSGLVTLDELFGELMMELLELSTFVESAVSAEDRERTYLRNLRRRAPAAGPDAIVTFKQSTSKRKESLEKEPLASHP